MPQRCVNPIGVTGLEFTSTATGSSEWSVVVE